MKWIARLSMVICLLSTACPAGATEPPRNCPSWWAYWKQCCLGYSRPCCGCPDDYCWKPLSPVYCRYCPKGCDTYGWKPLPPVFCRYCPKGCDIYDWKPYPCCPSNCRPWYSCGAMQRQTSPDCEGGVQLHRIAVPPP
jgi:hypothetical protein